MEDTPLHPSMDDVDQSPLSSKQEMWQTSDSLDQQLSLLLIQDYGPGGQQKAQTTWTGEGAAQHLATPWRWPTNTKSLSTGGLAEADIFCAGCQVADIYASRSTNLLYYPLLLIARFAALAAPIPSTVPTLIPSNWGG